MVRIKDVPIKDLNSSGLRKSNLSRSKGHLYKYRGVVFANDGSRKAIVKFNDLNDKKQITRVGFYEAIGADVALVKIVSFEGQKDVVLTGNDMVYGRIFKVVGQYMVKTNVYKELNLIANKNKPTKK
jgi:hypothetical protein